MTFKAIGFDYNGVININGHNDVKILKLIESLHSNGYKIGLISNYGRSGAEKIRQSGLTVHFDAVHFSGETGYVKPQPEAFLHLAGDLGVNIEQLIVVDDSPYCLSNAEHTGFTPILFTSYEDLLSHLGALCVKL